MTKGIAGIEKSVPWGVQSAVASSLLFYLLLHLRAIGVIKGFNRGEDTDLFFPQLAVAWFLVVTRVFPATQNVFSVLTDKITPGNLSGTKKSKAE
jgi:hypothetical protein